MRSSSTTCEIFLQRFSFRSRSGTREHLTDLEAWHRHRVQGDDRHPRSARCGSPCTRLSDEFGGDHAITLIDKAGSFVFGFSKLDVMFGKERPTSVAHYCGELAKPGLEFVQTNIRSIDPVARTVETDAGPFAGDILVVALGADPTLRPPRACSRAGTSSTRSTERSPSATCWLPSKVAM
jgi:hypothetical protein